MPPGAAKPHLLRSAVFSGLPWIVHGFSTRASGDLSSAKTAQRRFADGLAAGGRLIQLRQIHSSLVWQDAPARRAGDAHFTRRRGRWLAIRTADCLPILIADARQRVVAAAHAGWRGTLARIAQKTVGEMRAAYGCDPADLRAAIGPGIGACCYQVGEEVVQAFRARFDYADSLFMNAEEDPVSTRYPMLFLTGAPPGHPYDPRWNAQQPLRMDLAAANRRQLVDAGIPSAAVDILKQCTFCHAERFFSHRRGESARMLSAIGIVALERRKPHQRD